MFPQQGQKSYSEKWRDDWLVDFGHNSWIMTQYAQHVQHITQNWKDGIIHTSLEVPLNTLRPRQDGRHFADDIFKCIFFNENCCILIKFSLKYVRKGPIDNNPALVQIMAWRRSGDKPLSELMMISLPTHICVARPQWVKKIKGPFTWLKVAMIKEQGKSEGFESCDRPIVRKRPIWVKIGDVLSHVTLKFDGWPWKTIGHLSFAVWSFVQHFIAIGEFKLELLTGNAQFGSNSMIFRAVWPWNLTYDLEKQ